MSTCRFASRVMTLQTKAVVNESKDPRVIIRKHEADPGAQAGARDARHGDAGKAPVNYGEMGEVEPAGAEAAGGNVPRRGHATWTTCRASRSNRSGRYSAS